MSGSVPPGAPDAEPMSVPRVFICGVGILSPLGRGLAATAAALREGRRGLAPLELFACPFEAPLPVGEVRGFAAAGDLPRTHALALAAAADALDGTEGPPDAVVLGVTTGGMLSTEEHLKKGFRWPKPSPYHAAASVTECVAAAVGCPGPALTVATACSSGAAALKLALEMLRRGRVASVLAGGADSLCRLTYYGFNSLQIVDPDGARPFDRRRRGMSVAEGAALLLLRASATAPPGALAELRGGGLSCDAHHPAAPHPEGRGALAAMTAALADAGLTPGEIDYVNLHGTGTIENDQAEGRAVHAFFGGHPPPASSVKGCFGHSLAAAGAIEAVVAALALREGLIPGNIGGEQPDPDLLLVPEAVPRPARLTTVLSNSFGFGGNNAVLVLGRPELAPPPVRPAAAAGWVVEGAACLTGAGGTRASLEALAEGRACRGILPEEDLTAHLPPRSVRRMKRLARMSLGLAAAALDEAGPGAPTAVFMGTAWGALSETHDFIEKLYASHEFFASPIDFVGSVHNAPAGRVATHFQATGPNITMTGGNASFEQALAAAGLLSPEDAGRILVLAADELHPVFSRLFDPSVALDAAPSDGGGALALRRASPGAGPVLTPGWLGPGAHPRAVAGLVEHHGGTHGIRERYGAVLAGIPAAEREAGQGQLAEFLGLTGFDGPVVDYRRYTGEYAGASAVATVWAQAWVRRDGLPPAVCGKRSPGLKGRGVLVLGLGAWLASCTLQAGGAP